MTPSLLVDVVSGTHDGDSFAILYRQQHNGRIEIEVLTGHSAVGGELTDIPLPVKGEEIVVVVPFAQLREKGYACVDDDTALRFIRVAARSAVPFDAALATLPTGEVEIEGGGFDLDDEGYAAAVGRIIDTEIGTGAGSNFVLSRSFEATIRDFDRRKALILLRNLLVQERGAYWVFLVKIGDLYVVGASPERHVSLCDGIVSMNPISGTYRYPETGPTVEGVLTFLGDAKETDELYMVVDEELKMLSSICDDGLGVDGPYLKEMSRLAHTEYHIHGRTSTDPLTILGHTLFAPTVTGSPIENACRVIARHERRGRGYYAGVIALLGGVPSDQPALDSAILIRTAVVDGGGRVRIGVGSTIVRHSDPHAEALETKAKVRALLGAFGHQRAGRLSETAAVRDALQRRNATTSSYWLDRSLRSPREHRLRNISDVIIVDAEDTFTFMLADQIKALGFSVSVLSSWREFDPDAPRALVGFGPGPGDPRDRIDARLHNMRDKIATFAGRKRPFFGICLSHQLICDWLGLTISRRDTPNQGVQREINLFGKPEVVGFYNTFSARTQVDRFSAGAIGNVQVCRDALSGEVHALRADAFFSLQFHPESFLTQNGVEILGNEIKRITRQ